MAAAGLTLTLMGVGVPNENDYRTPTTSQRLCEYANWLRTPGQYDKESTATRFFVVIEAAEGIWQAIAGKQCVNRMGGRLSPDRVRTELYTLADHLTETQRVWRKFLTTREETTQWSSKVVSDKQLIDIRKSIAQLATYASRFKMTAAGNAPEVSLYGSLPPSKRIRKCADFFRMTSEADIAATDKPLLFATDAILLLMTEAAQDMLEAVEENQCVDSMGTPLSPEQVQTELEAFTNALAEAQKVYNQYLANPEKTIQLSSDVLNESRKDIEERLEELENYEKIFRTMVPDSSDDAPRPAPSNHMEGF
ncbi:MAG: hypothetical protein KGQ49_04970 [Verrucomicrobia bacterium]|nr:hypothetical protein [Verrucomicrobiota bacterium]MBU6446732.1 hypothetical protein [Verrucomicrobiota bacterium]MDE3047180.1 hypothetical protein [Verrucomicrobiota bacterium]